MTFDNATRAAAKVAKAAVEQTIKKYAAGGVTDEDDITGVLIGSLDTLLQGKIAGLNWNSTIVRHRRGKAAEEKRTGADLLIHVAMNTPTHKYSKGVLVQAKRVEPLQNLAPAMHKELVSQCDRMLAISPAAYVFNYATDSMRCAPAIKIAGSNRRDLYSDCGWTAYRFFLELFRCPVGDRNITSALVADLPVKNKILLTASGEFQPD